MSEAPSGMAPEALLFYWRSLNASPYTFERAAAQRGVKIIPPPDREKSEWKVEGAAGFLFAEELSRREAASLKMAIERYGPSMDWTNRRGSR